MHLSSKTVHTFRKDCVNIYVPQLINFKFLLLRILPWCWQAFWCTFGREHRGHSGILVSGLRTRYNLRKKNQICQLLSVLQVVHASGTPSSLPQNMECLFSSLPSFLHFCFHKEIFPIHLAFCKKNKKGIKRQIKLFPLIFDTCSRNTGEPKPDTLIHIRWSIDGFWPNYTENQPHAQGMDLHPHTQ